MELQGAEGVDVEECGDGANMGMLHGVGVGVEGEGDSNGRLHGVMFMGFLFNIWLSFSNDFVHLNPGITRVTILVTEPRNN